MRYLVSMFLTLKFTFYDCLPVCFFVDLSVCLSVCAKGLCKFLIPFGFAFFKSFLWLFHVAFSKINKMNQCLIKKNADRSLCIIKNNLVFTLFFFTTTILLIIIPFIYSFYLILFEFVIINKLKFSVYTQTLIYKLFNILK